MTCLHFVPDDFFSSLFGELSSKAGHSSSGFLKNLGPVNQSSRDFGVIPLVKAPAGLWLDLTKWNSSGSIVS